MNKKLYKSEDNKVLCGVCGGLGEFSCIDPTNHPTDLGGTCICSRKRITDLSSGSGHYSEKTTGLRYAVFVRALI